MKFVEMLNNLMKDYSEHCLVRKNGTVLLEPGKIPKCRHMLFPPLSEGHIKEFLLDEYKLVFPEGYLEFLRSYNGANLHWERIAMNGFEFAHSMLVLYGLPRTQPFGRPFDMEEPFDIRIEDFDNRHKNIPSNYLKCGSYCRKNEEKENVDIFIDTKTGLVKSFIRNTDTLVGEWDNIDVCLCQLFEEQNNQKIYQETVF